MHIFVVVPMAHTKLVEACSCFDGSWMVCIHAEDTERNIVHSGSKDC